MGRIEFYFVINIEHGRIKIGDDDIVPAVEETLKHYELGDDEVSKGSKVSFVGIGHIANRFL